MTARCYSSQADEDFVFPATEPTVKVKVQCRCGVRSVTNFRPCVAFIRAFLAREPIFPHTLAGSSWCRDCKTLVKVTARSLHLA